MPSKTVSRPLQGKLKQTRNVLHKIDTNIHVYDRTDPFAAFNILLKLFGTLPTRTGSSQYKLTHDEHKLSVHLLSIIEPFVGPAHSRRTLTRQPTEILDAIAFFVDNRVDLVNLALSCKRLHAVICPRHTEYRLVRAKPSALGVWHHLSVHRALARNIRHLEVIDERAPSTASVIPHGVVLIPTDTDLESTDDELGRHAKQERFLAAALSKMTALHSFTWSCNHSPLSLEQLWPTLLRRCSLLQSIDVHDNLVFSPGLAGGGKVQTVLPKLKKVTLQTTKHTYGMPRSPELARISAMLNNAPNLESLTIAYRSSLPSPVLDNFLLLARFPALTSLTLTHLSLTSPYPSAAFLAAHPTLEILHLNISISGLLSSASTGGKPSLVLPAGSLPNLRELHASRDIAAAVLMTPSTLENRERPLEVIKGVSLGPGDDFFLESLRLGGVSVKRIDLARNGWGEMEEVKRLADCVPSLSWLDIGNGRKKVTGTSTNVVEWAAVLGVLPDLFAFHGVKFFYEVSAGITSSHVESGLVGPSDRSRMRKNEEVANVLGRRCAKLRRVDHWEEGSGRVVVLVRENEKKVGWEARRVRV